MVVLAPEVIETVSVPLSRVAETSPEDAPAVYVVPAVPPLTTADVGETLPDPITANVTVSPSSEVGLMGLLAEFWLNEAVIGVV